jgi:hypothetical protein
MPDSSRIVDANTGKLRHRVRGERIVDAGIGQLLFRFRTENLGRAGADRPD